MKTFEIASAPTVHSWSAKAQKASARTRAAGVMLNSSACEFAPARGERSSRCGSLRSARAPALLRVDETVAAQDPLQRSERAGPAQSFKKTAD
jgi:hypothetical protein